jgi:hypothetical protein
MRQEKQFGITTILYITLVVVSITIIFSQITLHKALASTESLSLTTWYVYMPLIVREFSNLPPIPPYQPNIGDPFYWWGGTSNTYQVWISNLQEEMCGAWVCPDDNHNHLYNPTWVYVGQSRGTATFIFPFQAKDIMITWGEGDRFAFDSLIGNINGQPVAYGYTVEGIQSSHWFDSSNIQASTLIKYDFGFGPLPSPCGIVGPLPDNNYNITGYGGGILSRFLNKPYEQLWEERELIHVHQQAYSLNGITIIAKPLDTLISTDIICP